VTQEFRPRQVLIKAEDMAAAIAFYRDGLGMRISFQDGERYVAFEPLQISLALASASETSEPVVVAYRVLDVAAAAAELEHAGATVVEPPRRTAHEDRAALRDPSGTPMSLYAPVRPPAADAQ
jgi:predicted enzyme related to lactoylglutathione lyase